MKQICHVAWEVNISLMTIFVGLKIIIGVMRVFLSIDMLRSAINLVVALQPVNPMSELGHSNYLKQRSREQILTRKRTTVELCDSDTNLVVLDAKKAKFIPKIGKIKTDTLKYLYFVKRRSDRTKSWPLLLLPTQTLWSEVNRQA